jgi:hypothetical protein
MFHLQQVWTRITVNAAEGEDEVVHEAISVVVELLGSGTSVAQQETPAQ